MSPCLYCGKPTDDGIDEHDDCVAAAIETSDDELAMLVMRGEYDSNIAPIVVVCGSRDWTDRAAIRRDLQLLPRETIVVEGGYRGADLLAREVADDLGMHVATVPARWKALGRAAGPVRNAAMLRLRPSFVLAYDLGGPGTFDMRRRAGLAGIPVIQRRPA